MNNLIPEKAWLSEVSVKGKTMSLAGNSIGLAQVNTFFQGLNQSIFFDNVILKETGQKGDFQEFKLEATIVKSN